MDVRTDNADRSRHVGAVMTKSSREHILGIVVVSKRQRRSRTSRRSHYSRSTTPWLVAIRMYSSAVVPRADNETSAGDVVVMLSRTREIRVCDTNLSAGPPVPSSQSSVSRVNFLFQISPQKKGQNGLDAGIATVTVHIAATQNAQSHVCFRLWRHLRMDSYPSRASGTTSLSNPEGHT